MEDSQIIELYWQRSESAITETSHKYGKLCRRIAMNIVGNYSDAEECENDTYIAVWNAIPPTRPNIFAAFFIQHITEGGSHVDLTVYNSQISELISALIIYLCGFVGFLKSVMKMSLARAEEKKSVIEGNIETEKENHEKGGEK